MRRHERAVSDALAQHGRGAIRRVAPYLFKWASDERNLRSAWEHLEAYGGDAPGPNGLTYANVPPQYVWGILRGLRDAIRDGTYRPGPDRRVRIPKPSGGTRVLRLQDIEDRVVQRGIVEVVQPLLDPFLDEYSFGFRPGRTREHALIRADQLARAADHWVWITQDLVDAFGRVPHGRLRDVLRANLPNEDLIRLTDVVTENGQRRGLRQGSPLSPLLLNLFLDHFLDTPWRRRHPETPLLRWADDLLVLCRTQEEAHQTHSALGELLQPTGMQLKYRQETAIVALTEDNAADWLGYSVFRRNRGLRVRIAEEAWRHLGNHLAETHSKPASPLRAAETIQGWLTQQGPCFPHQDAQRACSRIREIAGSLGFEEIPSERELQRLWQLAYARFCRLRRSIEEQQEQE